MYGANLFRALYVGVQLRRFTQLLSLFPAPKKVSPKRFGKKKVLLLVEPVREVAAVYLLLCSATVLLSFSTREFFPGIVGAGGDFKP